MFVAPFIRALLTAHFHVLGSLQSLSLWLMWVHEGRGNVIMENPLQFSPAPSRFHHMIHIPYPPLSAFWMNAFWHSMIIPTNLSVLCGLLYIGESKCRLGNHFADQLCGYLLVVYKMMRCIVKVDVSLVRCCVICWVLPTTFVFTLS